MNTRLLRHASVHVESIILGDLYKQRDRCFNLYDVIRLPERIHCMHAYLLPYYIYMLVSICSCIVVLAFHTNVIFVKLFILLLWLSMNARSVAYSDLRKINIR